MSLICIQDQDEYYQNGTFTSVLFQRQIPIHIDPEVDMAYAEQCVEHFNHLSDQMIDQFCKMAIAYCEFMREEWAECTLNRRRKLFPDIPFPAPASGNRSMHWTGLYAAIKISM